MNTAHAPTEPQRPVFTPDPSLSGLSFIGVVRSELAKLLALRTTYWLSAITLGLSLLIAGSVAWSLSQWSEGESQAMLAESAMAGMYFALLLLGALAVICMTTEFTTGAIRSSMTAVPRRSMLYLGKALALTILIAVVTAVLIIACHVLAVLLGGELELTAPFTDSDVAYIYLTHWIAVVLTGLLGFGLGALLRSSAGGIVVLTVIVFVLQVVFTIILGVSDGADWAVALAQSDFSYLITQFTSPPSETSVDAMEFLGLGTLELWQSTLGLVIWTAVPFVLGWVTFQRRDV
ncbi:ABC transporter permease subunit [Nesterenkonia flava]|uniref:ABC transporter permease subunit n=1 Tax=Nesterenkonia flava TaxID=469799 RepID=A0ABU1FT06_9MICC|nr:ABC transporter permease subunit [Nesterenkonia flava]MDR5711779.1 ABC transporter permease subunit [Nesterenkonia flava]